MTVITELRNWTKEHPSFSAAAAIFILSTAWHVLALSGANHLLGSPFESWIGASCQRDCGWYQTIHTDGYFRIAPADNPLGQANWAFFPAFPLLVTVIARLPGLDFTSAAILLNGGAMALTIFLLVRFRDIYGAPTFLSGVLVAAGFALSPYALYGRIPYTEALFNLTLLATLIAWRRERFVLAAVLGIVLTATRNVGVLLPLIFAAATLYEYRFNINRVVTDGYARWAAIAVMPLGLVGYGLYLALTMGDPLAFVHVQAAWGRAGHGLIIGIARSFNVAFHYGGFVYLEMIALAGALAGCIWMLRKPELATGAVFLIITLIAAGSTAWWSLDRYILAPVFLYFLLARFPVWMSATAIVGFAIAYLPFAYWWVQARGFMI